MTIFTSQYRYDGEGRLDITAKSKDLLGVKFAPTWDMINKFKNGGTKDEYVNEYTEMMRKLYSEDKNAWNELLQKERIVLVCFCPPNKFCHRHLLKEFLIKCGAKSGRELILN